MGKPNPSFEKRLREQKKRMKREEKAQRKADRAIAKKEGRPLGEPDTEQRDGPDESSDKRSE